jgi:type I restriction enzyme S subunit
MSSGEIPWFKVGDMNEPGNERYMNKSEKYLSRTEVGGLRLTVFPLGTVIFPKRGGAIATNKKRQLVMPSCADLNTMAFVPVELVSRYLWWWFCSLDLGSLSDGSNIPQINHSDINPLPVPLPPLDEQDEIVRRVEALFKLAEAIEKRVATGTLRAEKLTQAIFAKAFRGELVPTEAELARREGRSYESAADLLARIRAERNTESNNGDGPKARKRRNR